VAVATAPSGTVYVIHPGGTEAGISDGSTRVAKSTDKGVTWIPTAGSVAMRGRSFVASAIAVTPDGNVHVVGLGNPDGHGNLVNVFRFTSPDGG